jgi:hypothetical protein
MTNTNIELTYNYTLDSIKVVEEGISKIKAKLIAVLTLSGVLVIPFRSTGATHRSTKAHLSKGGWGDKL